MISGIFVSGGNFKISNMAAEKKKRKKRHDSTCALKPPLDFMESPYDGQKHYCNTPVQAARRPFLAPALPVDDDLSLKWVSPQFPYQIDDEEELVSLRPNKKSRGKRKKQENAQRVPDQFNTKKHVYGVLELQCTENASKLSSKKDKENNQRPCRRSQRIKLKELQSTHFLFQESLVRTPVNRRNEEVLAYETPDHELVMIAKKQQPRSRGQIT